MIRTTVKFPVIVVLAFLFALSGMPAWADRDRGGVSIVFSFYQTLGDYYAVPQREVFEVRRMRISDEEVPVVFHIASRARVAPAAVATHRLHGMTWLEITRLYGLGPEIYFIPVKDRVYGPPYGKAWGHYKQNKHQGKYKYKTRGKVRLDDDDIVDLVNLRVLSDRYGYPHDRILFMRSRGSSYLVIHDTLRSRR